MEHLSISLTFCIILNTIFYIIFVNVNVSKKYYTCVKNKSSNF